MKTTKKTRIKKPCEERPPPPPPLPPIEFVDVVVSTEEMLARHPPEYSKGILCAICSTPLDDFFSHYPSAVCHGCDSRALNEEGNSARHICEFPESIEYARAHSDTLVDFGDDGDNPVFIDGHRCWRRYKFGGWVTMREQITVSSSQST